MATIHLESKDKIKYLNSEALYKVMIGILNRDSGFDQVYEHFWVVSLDTRNYVNIIDLLAIGDRANSILDFPRALDFTLRKGAESIILVHNHLGDSIEPDEADIDDTDFLYHAAAYLGLWVRDHLIINDKGFHSMDNAGIIEDRIEKSEKHLNRITADKSIEQLKKVYLNKGIKKGLHDTVCRMIKKGFSPNEIAELTALSPEEIETLK